MHTDVVVVGAGPAGSTAARELAQRGVEVVMLDRARFPRDKPCGGAVTIRCANLLPFSLDPIVEDVIDRARLRFRAGRDVVREAGRPITYMTQRCRLDAYLAEQAQAVGAEFRDGQRVTGVRQLPDATYEVEAGGEVYSARVVIGADGANGVVGTHLGYEHAAESAVALEGNIAMPDGVPEEWRHAVTLNFGYLPGGYGWVFPKGDHINVGVGGWKGVVGAKLRPALERVCRVYGLDPGALVQLRGHHLPMQRRGMVMAAAGSAVIGDAGGLVDPLSGEGIYAAILSGSAVAPAVEDYLAGRASSLAPYHRTVEAELLSEVATSARLTELFHAWPRPFVWAMQRSDRVWARCCQLLAEDTTYSDIVEGTGPLARTLGPLASAAGRLNRRRHPER
jgi:geranylgeranyl reductase family protein